MDIEEKLQIEIINYVKTNPAVFTLQGIETKFQQHNALRSVMNNIHPMYIKSDITPPFFVSITEKGIDYLNEEVDKAEHIKNEREYIKASLGVADSVIKTNDNIAKANKHLADSNKRQEEFNKVSNKRMFIVSIITMIAIIVQSIVAYLQYKDNLESRKKELMLNQEKTQQYKLLSPCHKNQE